MNNHDAIIYYDLHDAGCTFFEKAHTHEEEGCHMITLGWVRDSVAMVLCRQPIARFHGDSLRKVEAQDSAET